MPIKLILLILTTIINFFFGTYIFLKNRRNKSNIFYGLLCVVASVWVFSYIFIHSSTDVYFLNKIVVKMNYIPALLIPWLYLLFAYYFPYPLEVFPRKIIRFSILIPLLLEVFLISGILQLERFYLVGGRIIETSVFPDYLILTIYYILYVLGGLYILLKKYFQADGMIKEQLKFIILATLSAFSFGLIVSLILPFFNNFTFDWLGPVFTLFNFIIVSYFIFVKSRRES